MDEKEVRQLIREEIQRNRASSQFGYTKVPFHTHNGLDSVQIQENSIIPSANISGSITFEQATQYTLNLNSAFTPSFVIAYGNIIGDSNERFMSVGTASLSRGYYFQPLTDTSVTTGNIEYPLGGEPLQSAVYIGVDSSGTHRTLVTETNIVSVQYADTIYARATIIEFSKERIVIDIPFLTSGWSMNINYVVT